MHFTNFQRWKVLRTMACAAWVAGWLACAVLCVAQAPPSDSPDDVSDLSLEALKKVQVYSASSYLQDDRKAPSSVTVVTAEEIRRCGYRTLAEILRNVRGFYVTNDRNYSYLGVRGFSRPGDYNSRVLVLLNGHRLNDGIYESALIGREFQIDVDLIDRVEIVRGPSSSLYGTSAFFAVVDVITRNAGHAEKLEFAGEGDGFGTYKARATYSHQFHKLGMLFSATTYASDRAGRLFFPAYANPATNNGYAIDVDGDSSQSFMGQLTFGHFTLESVYSTRSKTIPTGSFASVFNDPRTHTVDDRGYIELRYDRTIAGTDLEARGYVDRSTYHGVYVYPPQGPTGDTLNEDFGRGDWAGTAVRATRTLWKKNKVTGGGEVWDNLRQDQSNYDVNPYVQHMTDAHSTTEWAIFAQDEYSILNKLTINAGVRRDYYKLFHGSTNPRLALIYSPLSRTTFKLLYGTAFRAPNYYELYYHDQITQEANPNLKPETISTTELVWEQDVSSKLRFSADAFNNRIRTLINQETDPATGFLEYENSGRVRSRGVELELAGRTAFNIDGRISYSFQKTTDEATGIALTNSPRHLAKAQAVLPLAHWRLFVGADVQYMSSRTTVAGTEVGSYTIADLTLSTHECAKGFQFSASLYNAFNHIYSDPVGPEIVTTEVRQNGRDFRISLTRTIHFK
jgi:outer membrane receptor for ferrienterochelin and colicins